MNLKSKIGKILLVIMTVIFLSMYLIINPQILDSFLSNSYFLLGIEWSVLMIVFFLIPKWLKKPLRLNLWQGLLLLAPVIGVLIYHQFSILGVDLLDLFSSIVKVNLSLWVHTLVFILFMISAICTSRVFVAGKDQFGIFHLGLGLAIQIWISTLLAWAGMFNILTASLLLLAPLIIQWKSSLGLLKKYWTRSYTVTQGHLHQTIWLSAGVVALAYILINMMKPIAVGHDGNSLYLYLSHQIAHSGAWLNGGQPFAMSIYYALPEAIFGNPSFALFHAHAMGFVACIIAIDIFQKNMTLLARTTTIVLLLTLPFMDFHWFVDEKIDLGLAVLILSMVHGWQNGLFTSTWTFRYFKSDKAYPIFPLMLFTCLIALTVKYSSILYILPLIPTWLWAKKKKKLSMASALIISGIMVAVPTISLINKSMNSTHSTWVGSILICIGLGLIVLNRKQLKVQPKLILRHSLSTLIIFIMVLGPWGIKHYSEHDSFSIENILTGKENVPNLNSDQEKTDLGWQSMEGPTKAIPVQNTPRPSSKSVEKKAHHSIAETEILRYQGLEGNSERWWSALPDIAFNVNLPGSRSNQLGIFFLLIFSIVIFTKLPPKLGLISIGTSSLFILLSVGSMTQHLKLLGKGEWQNWGNLGFDSKDILSSVVQAPGHLFLGLGKWINTLTGLPNLLPELIVIPLLLGGMIFIGWKIAERSSQYSSIWIWVMSSVLLWTAVGHGIAWYNLGAWIMLIPLLLHTALYWKSKELQYLSKTILGLQLLMNMSQLTVSNFPEQQPEVLFPKVQLDYSMNLIPSRKQSNLKLQPQLREALRRLNSNKENIYLVNTELKYFIENGDGRILEDNYLSTFSNYAGKNNLKKGFTAILQKNGFRYILYDLRTSNVIGMESEELQGRVQAFLKHLTTSPECKLVNTDNIIESQTETMTAPNGQSVKAKYGIEGKTLSLGTFALFEIKR